MITAKETKKIALSLGADLCGIASVERFSEAPQGFRPTDIYPQCKSVIVLAKRLPPALLDAASMIPYSHANECQPHQLDYIAIELCNRLADKDVNAVQVPSDSPYEYWEAERKHGRGLLSLKHAAVLAGLGELGKNTLLITEKYGNMVTLGAVLADVELKPDPLLEKRLCIPGCRKCLDSCPVGALDGTAAEQKKCRENAYTQNSRGFSITRCAICRRVCPSRR